MYMCHWHSLFHRAKFRCTECIAKLERLLTKMELLDQVTLAKKITP